MTTQLLIGQMALAEIGTRSTVTTSGTTPNGTVFNDGSQEARYLDMFYNAVRDHALRAARWNFAKSVVPLILWKALPGTPENTTSPTTSGWSPKYPAPPWLYSYNLPTNYNYARRVIAQPDISTISPPIFTTGGINVTLPGNLTAPFEIAIDQYDNAGVIFATPKKVLLTNAPTPVFEYTYEATDETLWDPEFVMVMVLAMAARIAIALRSDKQMAQLKLDGANNAILAARVADANEGLTILDHVPDWIAVRGAGANSPNNFVYPYGPLFSSWW
jgi:hypothetical protein